jgi:hypothetical protein
LREGLGNRLSPFGLEIGSKEVSRRHERRNAALAGVGVTHEIELSFTTTLVGLYGLGELGNAASP